MIEGRAGDAVFAGGVIGNPTDTFFVDEALTVCAAATAGSSPMGSTAVVGACVVGADVSVSGALGSGLVASAEGGSAAICTQYRTIHYIQEQVFISQGATIPLL
jgi:hypothetical protein